MIKTGRNDPCPCGSGKKYKRCCLEKHEAAARALSAATLRPTIPDEIANTIAQFDDKTGDELTTASNAAADLVRAGKLDEAERAARDLLEHFPDVHDGWDRLGMVYQARGDKQKAADCYRKVIAFIRAHPEQYDDGFDVVFRDLVEELDPSPSA
jgi:tetratricopeptide (TPR) repeat protein